MSRQTISIIVPAYNTGEKKITRAIESAVIQDEIRQVIVVDDGSTDETPEILDLLARKYDKLEVIHKPNGGVSSARNRALEEVRCDYIAFLDADDQLDPHFARRSLRVIRESGADLVIGSYEYRRIDGLCEKYGNPEIDDYLLVTKNEMPYLLGSLFDGKQLTKIGLNPMRYTGNWSMLSSASVVSGLQFDEGIAISEDRLCNYRLFMRCTSVAITGEQFYIYNQTEGSASQKFRPYAVDEMIATASAIKALPTFDNKDLEAALESGIVECFEQAILFSVRNMETKKKKEEYRTRIDTIRVLMNTPIFSEAISLWHPLGYKNKLLRYLIQKKAARSLLAVYDLWDLLKS